jgi:hypothetical protein
VTKVTRNPVANTFSTCAAPFDCAVKGVSGPWACLHTIQKGAARPDDKNTPSQWSDTRNDFSGHAFVAQFGKRIFVAIRSPWTVTLIMASIATVAFFVTQAEVWPFGGLFRSDR